MELQASAVASYDDYRGYQDQLASQMDNITSSAEDRLFQIVGAYPDTPEYKTPQNNDGCEIWLQQNSIETAQLQIERNGIEIHNLIEEIQIEQRRSGSAAYAMIRFGNQQATLTRQIGYINARQARANEMAAAADGVSFTAGFICADVTISAGVVAHSVNAGVQFAAEKDKGNLEGDKEQLAAVESAEIEGIDNIAKVKTLLLGMKTLAIDSQEAANLLKQETGRLAALFREIEDLERTLAESASSLAGR